MLKKIIYNTNFFSSLVILTIFLSACSANEGIEKKSKSSVFIYTPKAYKKKYGHGFANQNKPTFIGIRSKDLELLEYNFVKATKKEEREDISYNRKPIMLKRSYPQMKIFLSQKGNISLLARHLGYLKKNIKTIVAKNNNAIVSFVKHTKTDFIYEIYLVSINNKKIMIKLIDYLYT